MALVQPSHGIALLPAPEAPVHMPGISEEDGEEEGIPIIEAWLMPSPSLYHRPLIYLSYLIYLIYLLSI